MSATPYEVTTLDELERLPVAAEGLMWRPLRRRLGISAFGANAYTAEQPGQRVVEEHREARNGHEELYVVVSGRATFTLEDTAVDAPAGTLVFVRPGTLRGAVAAEGATTVLALGAKPGAPFEPSAWEDAFAAAAYGRLGRVDEGVELMREAIARRPDDWEGWYNLACIESLAGRREDALASLERAVGLNADEVRRYAAEDDDFDLIRDDPRFAELASR